MTRSGTILLVEDNEDDIELTVRAFAKSGVANDLAVARNGEEALAYLHRDDGHPLPEVVLLDLKLPKIDGLEVLRRMREDPRTRRLPVVVLTSSNEEQDMLSSYELGANSFVRKPVDFARFIEAARQLGLYWLMLNEQPPPRGLRGGG
jgi:two-component system response regulator